jgi:ankyrin repeat protein
MADNEGNTALYYSLKSSDAATARYLIKKGADYNQPNNEGETPVGLAVEKGLDTVLELMTDIR